jgi:hypothetical protein
MDKDLHARRGGGCGGDRDWWSGSYVDIDARWWSGAASTSAASTSTLAPASVSHPATARKVSRAASRRGTLLKTANLSTRAGVVRYLRAIGLDPRVKGVKTRFALREN